MSRIIFAIVCTLILAWAALAAPMRPDPTPKREPAPRILLTDSNWGVWQMDGVHVSLSGHHHWHATGKLERQRRHPQLSRLHDPEPTSELIS